MSKETKAGVKSKKAETTPQRNVGGRPARPMPEPIPETPENIAKACMAGPPKKQRRYMEKPVS